QLCFSSAGEAGEQVVLREVWGLLDERTKEVIGQPRNCGLIANEALKGFPYSPTYIGRYARSVSWHRGHGVSFDPRVINHWPLGRRSDRRLGTYCLGRGRGCCPSSVRRRRVGIR